MKTTFSGLNATSTRIEHECVQFAPALHSCLKENMTGGVYPPGIDISHLSGPWATHTVTGPDADIVRDALDAADAARTPVVASPELLEAMRRLVAAYPNVYQADGDASGWMGESILGNAL